MAKRSKALRESEDRLRQAVRVAGLGIFEHNHLTGELNYSPTMREMFGWSQDETVTLQATFWETRLNSSRRESSRERECGRRNAALGCGSISG